jgi:nicotinic acid mononucleotide adenylyltransferase
MTKLLIKDSDWLESLDWGLAYGEDIKILLQNIINKKFPKYKTDEELIILIESGSLAPPHKMHIGLMEIVKKYIEENSNKKVVGGFLIPSSDGYVKYKLKKDFISLNHRVNMTKLWIKNSDWLECLDWGKANGIEIKILLQKIIDVTFPEYKNIKCVLVFGIDFYLRHKFNLKDEQICIFRPGYDIELVKKKYPKNLIFVEGKDEDVSSTLIRKAIRENNDKLINELTNKEIADYIKNNNIFNN